MNYSWRVRENQNESSELYHYGVKGMKWGVRRTPEQLGHKRTHKRLEGKPLKYTSPTKENVKGWAKWLGKSIVASVVPGAGMAFNAKSISNQVKMWDSKDYGKGTEKLSELKRKPEGVESSILEDVRKANKTGKKGYVKNCFNCVCALEMRRRGYDVEALPRSIGATEADYQKMFSGVKLHSSSISRKDGQSRKSWVMENYDYLCKNLEENPEGSRGFIGFSYEGTTSGHTISWEIENGQAVFYDPQSGKRGADRVLSLSNQDYTWGRLDAAKELETVTQVVGSKKGR